MSKNINTLIFFVNGLGLGNSTRCYSIIDAIKKKNKKVNIIVATSGNGYWFFKNQKEVDILHKLKQVSYKKKSGKLSAISTILSLFKILKIFSQNTNIAINLIKKYNPKVVLSDSFYFFPRILKNKNFKFISINNADYVVEKFFKTKKKPFSIYPQFFLIELIDYLYNFYFYDFILSPSFLTKSKIFKKKIYRIPPLIRSKLKINRDKKFKPLIMLSGSTFSTQIDDKFEGLSKFKKVDILGRDKIDNENKVFNYLGKIKNNVKFLNKYNAAVINAGFSALSEVYLLKKPSVIVPVPNHSEQYFNAKTLDSLGLAIFSKERKIFQNLNILKKNFIKYKKHYSRIKLKNGANLAASFIIKKMI